MPPPLHSKMILPTAPHPSRAKARATFPQGKASLRRVGTLLRHPIVHPLSRLWRQRSRGMTATGSHVDSYSLRGAQPYTPGAFFASPGGSGIKNLTLPGEIFSFYSASLAEISGLGRISPAADRAILVSSGPTSSYTSTENSTMFRIKAPSAPNSAATVTLMPSATPA